MIAVRRLNAVSQRIGSRLDDAAPDVAEVLLNLYRSDQRPLREVGPSRRCGLDPQLLHPPERQRVRIHRHADASLGQQCGDTGRDFRWNRIAVLGTDWIGGLEKNEREKCYQHVRKGARKEHFMKMISASSAASARCRAWLLSLLELERAIEQRALVAQRPLRAE